MPGRRGDVPAGGGGVINPVAPGTFSATASSSGIATFPLEGGFLTDLSIRVDGDISSGAVTGGPITIEAWLKRGDQLMRKLCFGAIQNEMTVKGSGQLPVIAGSQIVVKWRELSGTTTQVKVDAFVDPDGIGDSPSWTDETPATKLLYQARRVATQGNAGGGAVIVDIALAVGQTAILVSLSARNSGTNTAGVAVLDEDNAVNPWMANLGAVASAAGTSIYLPSIGTAASAAANYIQSLGHMLGPGEKLSVFQTGAGAQADTFTVAIALLISIGPEPTWDKSRSANQADVALAASTISAANTWQLVRV